MSMDTNRQFTPPHVNKFKYKNKKTKKKKDEYKK